MDSTSLQGIVPALVTPFRPDERIDYSAWQRIIDLMIASGVDGLFAAGGQGEFFSLEPEERVVALRFCRQHAAGRVPVYGNVGCVTTRETVKLAQQAEAEGIDFAVVVTPYYIRPSADELVDHYLEVCRAVRIPVLAYNIPERTGVDLTPGVVARIAAACENFAGLKDSSGDLARISELTALSAERPFSIFIGRDHMILPALKLGCAGAVTACANVAPRLFVDLYRAFRNGDEETAVRLQALVDPLRQAFGLHTFPSVIKEAMRIIGYPAGPCRKPVGPMPQEAREKLRVVLGALREEGYLPQPAKVTGA
ncbi:MAG TPA: 4-hydroxy-tetrahydrodipicolinate synthase [Bryobacteraceae bacterium]|nr:4-hydroxy-tetrahydrodipicolinate synthase [Bryobacteraceae bacterium]